MNTKNLSFEFRFVPLPDCLTGSAITEPIDLFQFISISLLCPFMSGPQYKLSLVPIEYKCLSLLHSVALVAGFCSFHLRFMTPQMQTINLNIFLNFFLLQQIFS